MPDLILLQVCSVRFKLFQPDCRPEMKLVDDMSQIICIFIENAQTNQSCKRHSATICPE